MKYILGVVAFILVVGMVGAWENGAMTFGVLLVQVARLLTFVMGIGLVADMCRFLYRLRCVKKRKQKLA